MLRCLLLGLLSSHQHLQYKLQPCVTSVNVLLLGGAICAESIEVLTHKQYCLSSANSWIGTRHTCQHVQGADC